MSNTRYATNTDHATFERFRPSRRLDQTTHHRPRNTRRDRLQAAARLAAIVGE